MTTSRKLISLVLGTALVANVASAAPRAGRSAGVTRKAVTIGFHAPTSGAVPLEDDSVDKGIRLYWRWLKSTGRSIEGRDVRTVVRNDNTNPSQAVAVCRRMVEEDNVFMLSGMMVEGTFGSVQMTACARYAASEDVPYMSLGMNKDEVSRLPRYFAATPTFKAQARWTADYFVSRLEGRRRANGVVMHDIPQSTEPVNAFRRAMNDRGGQADVVRLVPKNASTQDAVTVVQELQTAEVDNVFIFVAPNFFIQILKAAANQGYRPTWSTMGPTQLLLDDFPTAVCPDDSSVKVRSLSPIPAFADRDAFDPTFSRAAQRIFDTDGDFIMWQGWATSRLLAAFLRSTGPKLTRPRFVTNTEGTAFNTGITPSGRFKKRDHFAGGSIHLLKMRCDPRGWQTVDRFVKDF